MKILIYNYNKYFFFVEIIGKEAAKILIIIHTVGPTSTILNQE